MSTSAPHSSAVARLAALALPGTVHLGRTATEPLRRLSTGIAALDDALDGGWPRGRLSEVAGGRSCGKTSLLCAGLAAATRRGETVACIDLAGALHPESLQHAGAELARVLWARPPAAPAAVRCAELLLQAGGFAVVALDFGDVLPRGLRGSTWLRLARASEGARCALIVLAPRRLAASSAAVGMELRRQHIRWQPGAWCLLDGFDLAIRSVRHPQRQFGVQVGHGDWGTTEAQRAQG